MAFLNLLYTDPEVVNLLLYGIEGRHYRLLEDGTIDYPEGIDSESVGYVNTSSNALPNLFLSRVWVGSPPDLWEQARARYRSAPRSGLLGFRFESGPFTARSNALADAAARYTYGLGTGQLDPEVYLPRMLSEMDDLGLTEVQEAIQAQFTQWQKEGAAHP